MKSHPLSEDLAVLVKKFSEVSRQAAENGETLPLVFPDSSNVTVTDVAIVVDAMLRAVDMDIFEIQMWRSLGRV